MVNNYNKNCIICKKLPIITDKNNGKTFCGSCDYVILKKADYINTE